MAKITYNLNYHDVLKEEFDEFKTQLDIPSNYNTCWETSRKGKDGKMVSGGVVEYDCRHKTTKKPYTYTVESFGEDANYIIVPDMEFVEPQPSKLFKKK